MTLAEKILEKFREKCFGQMIYENQTIKLKDADEIVQSILNEEQEPIGEVVETEMYGLCYRLKDLDYRGKIYAYPQANDDLQERLDVAVERLNEAIEFIDIFFGNCVYSEGHPTSYDSEISSPGFNRLLDFKEKLIKETQALQQIERKD